MATEIQWIDENNINIVYKTEEDLYKAYMNFIKGGGLFIKLNKQYKGGETINLKIKLLAENEQYEAESKVVWLTPKNALDNRPEGIGVQLSAEAKALRNKIETYLAGSAKSEQVTDTL